MNLSRGEGGYTLVELVVVLILLGVLTAAAAPNLNAAAEGMRLDTAARQLAFDIRAMRQYAIANNTSAQINLRASYYQLIYRKDGWETGRETRSFPPGVTFPLGAYETVTISFGNDGVPIAGAATYLLQSSGGKLISLTVTPVTGRVQVFEQ